MLSWSCCAAISERYGKLAEVFDISSEDDVRRLLEMDSIGREHIRRRGNREEAVDSKEAALKVVEEKLRKKQQEVYVKQEAVRTLQADVGRVEEELQKADALLLLTDVEGVRDKSGELLPELSAKDVERLVADGTVSGGMTPKLAAAVGAIENGAKAARIVDGRTSWLDAWGTQIT